MSATTPRAIIYARFSPRRNAEDCESCETQRAYCEDYARKQGYELGPYYEDREMSGSDADRPGLWNAVEECRDGDVLLAYRPDRLARDVYLHECIRRAVEGKGAVVECVSGTVNGEGPEQTMIRQILAALAEYERKIIAIRTKHAMLFHQKNGRRMSRFAPYGWEIDPDNPRKLREHYEEQEVIGQIVQWHAEGLTHTEIVKELVAKGIPPRPSAAAWSWKQVRAIVERARVTGRL